MISQELSKVKRRAFAGVMLGLGLVGLLLTVELTLRAIGYDRSRPSLFDGEGTSHDPDPVLGWRNKPGRYTFKTSASGGVEIVTTFLDGGRRDTGYRGVPATGRVVLVGCSFTQGWAISDEDTYAWKLQREFPDVEFLNFGTGAYGTYQSLLALERYFESASGAPPRLVLYGFIDAHEARNVAPWWWLKGLSQQAVRGQVYMPYCSIGGDGTLVRHPPERYPEWPGHESLLGVRFFEDLYMRIATFARRKQRREVTEKLLVEMNALCLRHGATFRVVFLSSEAPMKAHYAAFMKNRGIEFFDCSRELTPEFQVPGEGHPNGVLNGLWSDCIASEVRRALGASKKGAP